MTLHPSEAYSNLTKPLRFKDTKMPFGRRGYSFKTRHDTVQEGLGAFERRLERNIRVRKKKPKGLKKKKTTKRKLKLR